MSQQPRLARPGVTNNEAERLPRHIAFGRPPPPEGARRAFRHAPLPLQMYIDLYRVCTADSIHFLHTMEHPLVLGKQHDMSTLSSRPI